VFGCKRNIVVFVFVNLAVFAAVTVLLLSMQRLEFRASPATLADDDILIDFLETNHLPSLPYQVEFHFLPT
jgi:hypothetical protein